MAGVLIKRIKPSSAYQAQQVQQDGQSGLSFDYTAFAGPWLVALNNQLNVELTVQCVCPIACLATP